MRAESKRTWKGSDAVHRYILFSSSLSPLGSSQLTEVDCEGCMDGTQQDFQLLNVSAEQYEAFIKFFNIEVNGIE